MGIETYSKTPGNNTNAPPNGAPEGWAPSQVNDVVRQIMADIRTFYENPQWINYGSTGLAYFDATDFVCTGDVTATYTVNRRVKAIVTAGTIYGTITAAVYSSPNTKVTVVWDSGALDAGLSAVSLGFETAGKAINYNILSGIPAPAVIVTTPPGLIAPYAFSTLPDPTAYGVWLFVGGNTIGNASSNATARANADTLNLFTGLWNTYSNSVLPILTSSGVAGTRGANAAADFAANMALPLLDLRHEIIAGWGGMSSAASRALLTSPVNGDTIGAFGGAQSVTLTLSQVPPDSVTVPFVNASGVGGGGNGYTRSGSTTVSTNGGGGSHTNVQPTIILPFIIKV